jgi:hypothetical protein
MFCKSKAFFDASILRSPENIFSTFKEPRNRFLKINSASLCSQLEFLKSLWGLGTKEEEGYRTGPPGYIGWRNSFLGIDSGPHTRLKIRAPRAVTTTIFLLGSWHP